MTDTPKLSRVDPVSLNPGEMIRFDETGPDYRVETIELLGEHARLGKLTVAPAAGGMTIDGLPRIQDDGCYRIARE